MYVCTDPSNFFIIRWSIYYFAMQIIYAQDAASQEFISWLSADYIHMSEHTRIVGMFAMNLVQSDTHRVDPKQKINRSTILDATTNQLFYLVKNWFSLAQVAKVWSANDKVWLALKKLYNQPTTSEQT